MVKFAAMKFAFISFLRGIYTNLNFSARHLISNYFGLRKDILFELLLYSLVLAS